MVIVSSISHEGIAKPPNETVRVKEKYSSLKFVDSSGAKNYGRAPVDRKEGKLLWGSDATLKHFARIIKDYGLLGYLCGARLSQAINIRSEGLSVRLNSAPINNSCGERGAS